MFQGPPLFVDYADLVKMGWKYAYGRTVEMEQEWFDRPKGPNGELGKVRNPRPFPKSEPGPYGRKRQGRDKDVITYFVQWRYIEKSEGEKLLGEKIDVERVPAEDLQIEAM